MDHQLKPDSHLSVNNFSTGKVGVDEQTNLILLPGLDGTGKLFKDFINLLPEAITPIVISYPKDRCLSIEELATYVLSKIPEGDFILLAESFSSLVALQLLPQISKRLLALIFAGGFASSPSPLLLKIASITSLPLHFSTYAPNFLIRRYCLGSGASNDACKEFRSILSDLSKKVLTHRLRLIAHAKTPKYFPIECPCFYLQATKDRLIPAKSAEWFQMNITKLHFAKIKASHLLLQEAPKECLAAIKEVF